MPFELCYCENQEVGPQPSHQEPTSVEGNSGNVRILFILLYYFSYLYHALLSGFETFGRKSSIVFVLSLSPIDPWVNSHLVVRLAVGQLYISKRGVVSSLEVAIEARRSKSKQEPIKIKLALDNKEDSKSSRSTNEIESLALDENTDSRSRFPAK